MRVLPIIVLINLTTIPFGCIIAGEDKDSPSEMSDNADEKSDTLIYSAPQNYSRVAENVDSSRTVKVRFDKDMLDLFDELNYTPAAWQAGIREVPRVYLPLIGDRWGSVTTKEITVENKKKLFFRGLAPMILLNEGDSNLSQLYFVLGFRF